MKKIIKPKQNEEANYFSDFTGKPLGEYCSVTVKIECGYGSKYDSSNITLHLDDSDLLNVIKILKVKISEDFKQQIKHNSVSLDKDLVDATQFRDWCNVEHLQNNIDLLKEFL